MIKVLGREIKVGKFPNNETYVDIPMELAKQCLTYDRIGVEMKFESNEDIWTLMTVKDYLDKLNHPGVYLSLPYIPYSRMDRSENRRLFSLKTFANLINSMNFNCVTVWEPHSDVSVALIDRVFVKDISVRLMKTLLADKFGINEPMDIDMAEKMAEKNICIVYPDAGAEKRYSKQLKCKNTITASKNRDFDTGEIKSLTLHGVEESKNCEYAIIVDDLSSAGNSFLYAGKELRKKIPNLKKVYLVVTHCENTITKGHLLTTDIIDEIWTTDSILIDDVNHDKIHKIIFAR